MKWIKLLRPIKSNLNGLSLNEILQNLKVFKKPSPQSTVKKLVPKFKLVHSSLEVDLREVRPKTATEDNSEKRYIWQLEMYEIAN